MADKDLDSRMTEIEVKFEHVSKQLDIIVTDIKQVLSLTSQVGILTERQTNHQNDINRAFDEIRKLNSSHTDYDREQDDRIKNLEVQFQTSDKESQAWVNRIKGGWFVFILLYGLIQGMMVYGAKLLIDEVRQQHDQLLTISNKIPR